MSSSPSSSSSLRWLPPLNSHDRYTTSVTIEQRKKSWYDPSVPEKLFSIKIDVSVTYYSDEDNQLTFPGLLLREEFKVPCRQTNRFPFSSMISVMGVNFQLDHIVLSQRCLEMNRFSSSGMEKRSLDGQILNFLNIVRFHKSYNYQNNVVPIRVKVLKTVEIPECEHVAWSSWYEQKKRVDPEFEDNYFAAVSRPRTNEELLYEASLTLKAMLEEVRLDDSNSRIIDCTICLEELPQRSTVLGLPCSHLFHGDCILKWLQESQNCPLCRFALPSRV